MHLFLRIIRIIRIILKLEGSFSLNTLREFKYLLSLLKKKFSTHCFHKFSHAQIANSNIITYLNTAHGIY